MPSSAPPATLASAPFGRLTRTTDPLGNVTRTDYGPDGHPLRLTDEDQPDPPAIRWTELHRIDHAMQRLQLAVDPTEVVLRAGGGA